MTRLTAGGRWGHRPYLAGVPHYNIESYSLKKYLRERSAIPFPQIETDYSESDAGQQKVRIEAFLEILHRSLGAA